MKYQDVVMGRRSIRGYQKKPVPKELIKQVLELAMRAPTSLNTQPWNFYVVTGEPLDRPCLRASELKDWEPLIEVLGRPAFRLMLDGERPAEVSDSLSMTVQLVLTLQIDQPVNLPGMSWTYIFWDKLVKAKVVPESTKALVGGFGSSILPTFTVSMWIL